MRHSQTFEVIADGKVLHSQSGQNLLELLRSNGIGVPSACYRRGGDRGAVCGLCIVEIEGRDSPVTSCTETVNQRLVVRTDSSALQEARRARLQMLFEQHYHEETCADCIWHGDCDYYFYAREWSLKIPTIERSTD